VSTGTIEKPAKAKKTKKVAEVAELPAGEAPARPTASCGIVQLENCSEKHLRVDVLDRHPANRRPGPEAVAKLVESISAVGLLEAVIVRPLGDRYQILSGETRWLAHRQVGAVVVRCKVVECSDAAALAVVAEANAKRTDLTTIERAQLIRQLCMPVDQGGSGFTRAEAAMVCGLESASAASNLVKLLDAPQEWQERLVRGMRCDGCVVPIHEATVREVAKFARFPQLLTAIEAEFQENGDFSRSRDAQLQLVDRAIVGCVRETKGKRYYGWQYGDHPCYLDLKDQELRAKLEIVHAPIDEDGKLVEVALNWKLWDELQIAEMKRRRLDTQNRSVGKMKKVKPADLSPKKQAAANRAKRKEQDEQLARWAEEWQLRLLRCSLAESIDPASEARWMLPWLIEQAARDYGCPLSELVDYAAFAGTLLYPKISIELMDKPISPLSDIADAILHVRGDLGAGGQLTQASNASLLSYRIARLILWPSDPDSEDELLVAKGLPEKMPQLGAKGLRKFADAFDTSVEEAWAQGARPDTQERELIKQLLIRHTGEQLDDLAAELGVDLDAKGKAARVEQLLAEHSFEVPLPLPKLLAGNDKKRKRKGGGA
jgi:ParB/RepB/Spo0J family partition protein